MKLFVIFLLIFILNRKIAQSARCRYEYKSSRYTCFFSLAKESEWYGNITTIEDDNEHYRSDDTVLEVIENYAENIKVLPSLICERFENLQTFTLNEAGIEEIRKNSLSNCMNLVDLTLTNNQIKRLPSNIFASQSELETLNLNNNLIEEIAVKVFAPLKKLRELLLSENKLKTLNSAAFGVLPKLKKLSINNNQLTSFDVRIFDNNKGLTKMNGHSNPCSEGKFSEKLMIGRDNLKGALKNCFENYTVPETDANTQENSDEHQLSKTIALIQELNAVVKSLMSSNDELRSDSVKIQTNIQFLIEEVKKLSSH